MKIMKLEFCNTDEWCIHNIKYVFENETQNNPLGILEETDHPILVKRKDLVLLKKITCHLLGFAVLAGLKLKMKEGNRKKIYRQIYRYCQ